MLLFAHVGIALGCTLIIDRFWQRDKNTKSKISAAGIDTAMASGTTFPKLESNTKHLSANINLYPEASTQEMTIVSMPLQENAKYISGNHVGRRISDFRFDYRLIILGSMLPDIIDKPVGQWLFKDVFSNGRIFSHTLLFLLVIIFVGFWLYLKMGRNGIINVASGVLVHLGLDVMWLVPCTFFWPICGLEFVKMDLSNWLEAILRELSHDPFTFIPEIVGTAVIIYFAVMVMIRKSLWYLVKTGDFRNNVK
jgi:inner membrane protein